VLGVVLGAGSLLLFYKPAYYFSHPLEIFAVWQGGMSFHAGSSACCSRSGGSRESTACAGSRSRISLRLWPRSHLLREGSVTSSTASFPAGSPMCPGNAVPRRGTAPAPPSQLYQFALEGVLLFVILWMYSAKPRPRERCRGLPPRLRVFRFTAEYFREPDDFLGLLALNLSMGSGCRRP